MWKRVLNFVALFSLVSSLGLARESRFRSQSTDVVSPSGVEILEEDAVALSLLKSRVPDFKVGWEFFERTKGFPVSLENVVKLVGTDNRTGERFELTFIPFVNPQRPMETCNVLIYTKRGSSVTVSGGIMDVSQNPPVVREGYSFQNGRILSWRDRLRNWASCTADFCTGAVVLCLKTGPAYTDCVVAGCAAFAAGCGLLEFLDWYEER